MIKNYLACAFAPVLTVGLLVGIADTSFAEVSKEERVELKLSSGGDAHVLVLDDFETFPVGATETVRTQGNEEALVTRQEEGLIVEIAGQQFTIELPERGELRLENFDIDLDALGVGSGEERIVIVTSDEHSESFESVLGGLDGADGERRIVIRTSDGSEASEIDVEVDHRVIVIDRRSDD